MAISLLLVQATYTFFNEQTFLLYNVLLFLLGLHTCFTYYVQVNIWENAQISKKDIWLAVGMMLLIAVLALTKFNSSFALSVFLFLFFKFFERVKFNFFIKSGEVLQAYLFSGVILLLELLLLLMFVYTSSINEEEVTRFIKPYLILVVIISLFAVRYLRISLGERVSNVYEKGFLALHSFFLLIVIMIDRVLGAFFDSKYFIDYLLLFSYATAVYALLVAVVEVKRPKYSEIAKKAEASVDYYRAIDLKAWLFNLTLLVVSSIVGGAIFGYYFGVHLGAKFSFESLIHWCLLLTIMGGFALLSIFQIYSLSRRNFSVLFMSWLIILVFKGLGITSGDLKLMLFSTLGGILLSLFYLYWKR